MNHFFRKSVWPGFMIVLFLFVGSSCTPLKKLTYFSDDSAAEVEKTEKFTYRLQAGDILYIRVLGPEEKTSQFFNNDPRAYNNNEVSLYINSYAINDSGFVELPVAGKILVSGMNLDQAKEEIRNKISDYIIEPTIILKLMSFQVTILGEVNHPGVYKTYDIKLNIFEALGLAGDMTTYGNRKSVEVIRNVDGKNTIYVFDLTSENVLHKEGFYLMPDDIVYVKPLRTKSFGFDKFPLTELLSSITTLILVLNFIK